MLTQAQIDEARQVDCCIPQGMKMAVLIRMLWGYDTPMTAEDIQTLVTRSRCVDSCVPAGMTMALAITQLNDLLNNATDADACILNGVGAPTLIPPCVTAIYFDTAFTPNMGLWVWLQSSGTWYEIIAAGP